ncbi:MAG: c-type cytochrome biogenesis protein CcmI [Rubrivivax sp.]
MLIFWLLAALLVAGALLLMLPALWRPRAAVQGQAGGANVAVYRDQLREAERDLAADLITPERHEQLKAEIQHRVLEDTRQAAAAPAAAGRPARRSALALALLIPAASIATYLVLGQPETAAPGFVEQQAAQARAQAQVTPEQIERMVATLAERLKSDPGNAEGWQMLGRSYAVLERYADAAAAYRKAAELLPGNADVLADLADVLGMSQGRSLAGEPTQVLQRALAADPQHGKSLALAGSAAFERKDYAAARGYWERLLAQVPAESEIARSLRGSIAEAAQLAGGGAAVAAAAAPAASSAPVSPASAPAGTAVITGEVRLSPALAARVAAGDTVYVFARAAEGPRLPLAIVRQAAGNWPLRFKLDDSMAMTPQLTLSGTPRVVVGARVSKSGDATPHSGDLIGQSEVVAHDAQGLTIVIDKVQP